MSHTLSTTKPPLLPAPSFFHCGTISPLTSFRQPNSPSTTSPFEYAIASYTLLSSCHHLRSASQGENLTPSSSEAGLYDAPPAPPGFSPKPELWLRSSKKESSGIAQGKNAGGAARLEVVGALLLLLRVHSVLLCIPQFSGKGGRGDR
jgi:hypothetical protein